MKKKRSSTEKARLEALLEEAIVDCYGESEQIGGIFTMIEENLKLPFETVVLGTRVTMTSVELTDDDQIVGLRARPRPAEDPNSRSSPAVATANGVGVDRSVPAPASSS